MPTSAPDTTERLWSPFFDASSDCVKLLSPDGAIQRINTAGREALGLDHGSEVGMSWIDLLPTELRDSGSEALKLAAAGIEAKIFGKTTSAVAEYTWNGLLTPVFENGILSGILCTARDVSREHAMHLDAVKRSEIDELTQLGNRRAILSVLNRLLREAKATNSQVAVMILDVDNLKAVNDTYGHRVGDDVLVRVARTIREHAAPEWYAGRIGGDEFMIVAGHAEFGFADYYERLHTAVRSIAGAPVVHNSMGLAIHSGSSVDAGLLMASADDSLYSDKRRRDMRRSLNRGLRRFA